MEELEKFYKWLRKEKVDLDWPFDMVYSDYQNRSLTRDEVLELPKGTKVRVVTASIISYIGDHYMIIDNDNPFLDLKSYNLWNLDTGYYEFELINT